MTYLWHDLMSYIWGVLFVVGIIFGAIIWIAMAIWDRVRAVGHAVSGEIDGPSDADRMPRG